MAISVKYTKNNIHIEDSHTLRGRYFKEHLELMKLEDSLPSLVWCRSIGSLEREWAVHNFLYSLHIARERTGSVDLNYPQRLWEKVGYNVIGVLVWIFIR